MVNFAFVSRGELYRNHPYVFLCSRILVSDFPKITHEAVVIRSEQDGLGKPGCYRRVREGAHHTWRW